MDEEKSLAADVLAIGQIEVVRKILEVVCRTTGMGFSAVARVTDKRWVACAVRDEIGFGLQPGGELELETTICHEIRQNRQAVAIDHVAEDPAFCGHHTPRQYGFQSYVSVPITLADGTFFGTLCALDPKPARVNTPAVVGTFTLFADLIAQHLDGRQRLLVSEGALAQERQIARLRDQFISVLGHDLRNPLGAILSAADVLAILQPAGEIREIVSIIQRSGTRIARLIDNVLDFARGTMGGGLAVRRTPDPALAKTLAGVIQELQIASPKRTIQQELRIEQTVSCDGARIAQVLSNLLANALMHGSPDEPVSVRAGSSPAGFELAVTNRGPTIAPEIIGQLFQPFTRGIARRGEQGLGLGLYIASEIARAHEGTIDVVSSDGQTCFTLRMPIA